MKSRYDIMKGSATEHDPEDLQRFPDPLSIDYSSFEFTEPPLQYEVTYLFLERPYVVTNALYGEPVYDDLILSINNIPHMSTLDAADEGVVLSLPGNNDLFSFIDQEE